MLEYKRSALLSFSGLVGKLILLESYEKSMKKEGFTGLPAIKEMVLDLRSRLPQLILQDLSLFVEQYKLEHWLCMTALKSEDLPVAQWLEAFKAKGPKAFLESYIETFIKIEGEPTDQAVKNFIEEANRYNFSDNRPSYKAYLEFKKDIDVIHSRFASGLEHILEHSSQLAMPHQSVYKEQEDKLLAYMENEDSFFEKLSIFQTILSGEADEGIEVYLEPYFEHNLMLYMSKPKPKLMLGLLSIRIFDEHYAQDQMQEMLKCLADPTKMAIIQMASKAPICGKDLAKSLKLSKATISHHLSKLCLYGIIDVSLKDKKVVYYTLRTEVIETLFENVLGQLKPQGNAES